MLKFIRLLKKYNECNRRVKPYPKTVIIKKKKKKNRQEERKCQHAQLDEIFVAVFPNGFDSFRVISSYQLLSDDQHCFWVLRWQRLLFFNVLQCCISCFWIRLQT